ncbi:hypothetical protein HPB52_009114 [Rhipicephalus sanguineus]|uniref:Fatty acyl-CoA reductase n=1 Tax=Rhipicephalus sanguineus TaxID=34632 RepID=A0A9D4T1L7_RHISA|nr:hypothetical protein HPB52_009114 [Rhipicephalus sanguineus]
MAPEVYRRRASATAVPADRQNEACQVSEFYNDREVLITGGTGFVGKVLLEKLLRSCSGLKRVYLLMRGKKGRGPQSRLEEMFDCRVFDRLKQEQPGIFEKVTAVSGDLAQPHLGLSVSDRNTLLGNVSVVFHSGAAIKFNEPFRPTYVKAYHCTSGSLKQQTWGELVDAMQRAVLKYPLPNTLCYPKISVTKSHLWYDINMYCKRLVPARATDMVLQLMRREPRFVQLHEKVRKSMGAAQYFVTHGWLFRTNNIVKLMHDLSLKDKQTFNIDMRSVDWYPYWDQCLLGIRKYLFKAEDSELPKARKQLTRYAASRVNGSTVTRKECLFGHPNTYTLTKNIAESLLLEERGNVPVVIVRPSIVTAALSEPVPGWVDNYKACTGIVVALGTGLLSSLMTEKKCLVDIVPVDIVANTLICVAWHTSTTRPTSVKVYHCASGTLQQYKWADLADAMQKAILRHPLPNIAYYPKFAVTNSYLWHRINLYCFRYLPARAADLGLMLIGREPRFVQRYKRAREAMDVAQYFMTRGWLFRTNNIALRPTLVHTGDAACVSVSTADDEDSMEPRIYRGDAFSKDM